MKCSKKRFAAMLAILKDLGIIEEHPEKSYKLTADFDLVIRGLLIKRLKRIQGEANQEQLQQSEIEALVDALTAYGFLTVTRKPTDVELAVNCLFTFKKED